MSEKKETLTIDDLKRVFIRAKMPDGSYDSIDCAEASDEQFDTWAKASPDRGACKNVLSSVICCGRLEHCICSRKM